MNPIELVPSFGGFAWTVLAFIVALSVIVFVHEFGHYIVGRWSGIKAEVFSIGFGPRLASWVDRHGTRWQVAALPFGGYVKFLGDADAASRPDVEAVAALPEDERVHSMAGAPLWARMATVVAGPVFNFILAILIFAGVMMVQGVATDAPVIGEIKPLPQGAGDLRAGDRILSVGGIETPGYDDLFAAADRIEPAPLVPYELDRDGQRLDGQGPFPMPPIVDAVQPRSAAADAGLRPGDVIVRVDGQPVYAFRQVREIVTNGDGRPLRLGIWRQGAELQVVLAPRRVDLPLPEGGFETRWLIGISGGLFFEPETRRAGPFEALRFGVEQTGFIIRSSLSGLVHMISGAISSCNLSGPVGIAETSGQAARAGLGSFVWFIGVLSAAIGLLNLFPIPVLDGGHLVFYAWEGLTGRPPSDQVVRFLMAIGMALILTMMIFAMANDLFLCP